MTIVEDDKLTQPSGTSPEAPIETEPKAPAETPKPEETPKSEGESAAAPPASGQDDDPEADIMARLTGADPKKNAPAAKPEAAAEPAVDPKVKAEDPPADPAKPEAPEEFKYPNSHELAGYPERTRKRIEQFTGRIKALDTELGTLKPKAAWADRWIAQAQAANFPPEKFGNWLNLGIDLAAGRANPELIYKLAIDSGYKPVAPAPVEVPSVDVDKVLALVHAKVAALDLSPEIGKEIMALVTAKPAKPAAPAAPVQPTPAPQPQRQQPTAEQVYSHYANEAMAQVNAAKAEYQAAHPATWAKHEAEITAELTKMESTMAPEIRDNPRLWAGRYVKAAERVLNRPATATPRSAQQPLRPSTTPSATATAQKGEADYELGLLMGTHSIIKG